MAIEREIEFKQLLNQESYEAVKTQYFNHQSPFKQVNYYIDTPDFQIQSQKMALRIREKADGTYELTLKVPDSVGLLEYNEKVDFQPEEKAPLPPQLLKRDIQKVLKAHDVQVDQLIVLGALTTYRLETQLAEGLLVLDHSLYLGTEDFELEFEVQDFKIGQHAFDKLLDRLGLTAHVPKNKVQRFFEYQQSNVAH